MIELNYQHKETCWDCGKTGRVFRFHHICHFHFTCWLQIAIKYRGNVDQWLWENSEFVDEEPKA